jgi:hypothetical protein
MGEIPRREGVRLRGWVRENVRSFEKRKEKEEGKYGGFHHFRIQRGAKRIRRERERGRGAKKLKQRKIKTGDQEMPLHWENCCLLLIA